jgi:isoleucyl-tRNA synthetase
LPAQLRGDAESVFDTSFDVARHRGASESDLRLWQLLRALRSRVAASASQRDFEAQLRLIVTPAEHKRLQALGDNLREALVVSQLHLAASESSESESSDGVVEFVLSPAEGEKCARCWKYRQLGTDPEHPSICADCAQVVRALHSVG